MREIKFRVYDKSFAERSMSYSDTWSNYEWGDLINYPERFALMQYTGLCDKEGTDIYEGDILDYVQINNSITEGVVSFEMGCFTVMQTQGEKLSDDLIYHSSGAKVIGNIYEGVQK